MPNMKTPKFEPSEHYHTAWWSFRYRRGETSFIHSAALIAPSGEIVARYNAHYCNRTWECHEGDSARHALADDLEHKAKYAELLKNPEVQKLITELKVSKSVSPVSCESGTLIGYSLSMWCPI